MRILVAHPGRQHSHQVALALHSRGWLAEYWSGIPCTRSQVRWLPEVLRLAIRYPYIQLPVSKVRWVPIAPIIRKAAEKMLPSAESRRIEYLGYQLFDRLVSYHVSEKSNITAVIAYENSALHTFQKAKTLGIRTILDAASVHHTSEVNVVDSHFQRLINKKKDIEIKLADQIITTSSMARDTYIASGFPKSKVSEVTLGADLTLFSPTTYLGNAKEDSIRFLFVGNTSKRKGVDLLLAAFRQAKGTSSCTLEVVGSPGDCDELIVSERSNGVILVKPKSQEQLVPHYQRADCLILPSRYDSFGMVVAEALACGLPVIVSDMVGAKSLVFEGVNGWVVGSKSVEALSKRIGWCIANPLELRKMREQVRVSAENATWPQYQKRLLDAIEMHHCND